MTSSHPARNPDGSSDAGRPELRDLEALFHRHYGALCEFVCGYVKSREVAEDLVQDLFVRLWELQSTSPAQSLALSYLYTAARNRAIGYLRKERVARAWADRTFGELDEAPERTSAEELHFQELTVAVESAIAALPERCRLIFTMSRHEGLSYSEIAQALGISRNTVETQISRALKSLRSRLLPFLGLVVTVLGR